MGIMRGTRGYAAAAGGAVPLWGCAATRRHPRPGTARGSDALHERPPASRIHVQRCAPVRAHPRSQQPTHVPNPLPSLPRTHGRVKLQHQQPPPRARPGPAGAQQLRHVLVLHQRQFVHRPLGRPAPGRPRSEGFYGDRALLQSAPPHRREAPGLQHLRPTGGGGCDPIAGPRGCPRPQNHPSWRPHLRNPPGVSSPEHPHAQGTPSPCAHGSKHRHPVTPSAAHPKSHIRSSQIGVPPPPRPTPKLPSLSPPVGAAPPAGSAAQEGPGWGALGGL